MFLAQLDLQQPIHDPVLIFGIVMLILLCAPLLFERMRMPGLVGLIFAGALVGPSAANLLERGETFQLLGQVGLLYLMFTAGLTLDLAQFQKLRNRSLVFGSASLLLPALLAFALGPWLLGFDLTQTLLMVAIVGSHTLLAFPVVSRLGIAGNQAVVMAVGGTIVTDVASLVVLAGVLASLDGEVGVGFWLSFAFGGALYVSILWFGAQRLGRWFFRAVQSRPETTFAFLMSVLFIGAWFANAAQLAPLIGAFLAGLAMNRLVPEQSTLMTRIKFVGDALLVPFFLVSVGMLVDVGVLFSSFEVWGVALVFTGVVLVGKGGSAWLVAAIYRHPHAERLVVSGLTIPQAAATLAVTLAAFDMELFNETVVNAVVVMILITCMVGPWMVERFGREVAAAEAPGSAAQDAAPQRILIPLANPQTVQSLTDIALLLHERDSPEPLYPLTISREADSAAIASAEKLLSQAVVYAAAAAVKCVPLTRIDQNIADGMHRAIAEQRISTVVIGWNGQRSAKEAIFGSVLDQLLDETRQMIIVVRGRRAIQINDRLVLAVPPFAHNEPGFGSLLHAVQQVAAQLATPVVVLSVGETVEIAADRLRAGRPSLTEVVEAPVASWTEINEHLSRILRANDLLIVWSARSGSVSWRPSMQALPTQLAQQFDNNLLIAYPPLVALQDLLHRSGDGVRGIEELLDPSRVVAALHGETATALLGRLLDLDFRPDDPRRVPIVAALLLHEGDSRPEISPGVILFHAHVGQVDDPRIYVGMCGLDVQLGDGPVHSVVAVLVPASYSMDVYLALVAAVAHRLRDPAWILRLTDASPTPQQPLPVASDA